MQYLQENVGDKVDFLSADKHNNLLQLDTITFSVHSKAFSKLSKNKVTISLQYFKENRNDEVDFLPADKRQSDTVILIVCGQVCLNYPK